MRAVLRLNTFDADKLAAASEQLEEFDRLHAVQPGYLGNVTVDVGQAAGSSLTFGRQPNTSKPASRHSARQSSIWSIRYSLFPPNLLPRAP